MVNAPKNIIEIWTAVPLPYLLITVKPIELQNVSIDDIQNLKTVS